ncbi:uncharacterized protein [Paralichthys olivaceus]|uniref:uncharacterized protein isoform X2 n=1 Tax=Paralichthys olivaceus TaxID=8255 RepID=UPI0037534B5D
MKLSSVVKALGSLCVLLADGFQVSEDGSPHIIGAERVQIKANPERSSSDRIVELEQSTLEDGTILQRRLLLKNVTPEDLKFTFTCVVMSAGGMAQKQIKLRRIRKKGKH